MDFRDFIGVRSGVVSSVFHLFGQIGAKYFEYQNKQVTQNKTLKCFIWNYRVIADIAWQKLTKIRPFYIKNNPRQDNNKSPPAKTMKSEIPVSEEFPPSVHVAPL